ncbi:hypothetical protein CDAR_586941 [Caerostris darwini]|uniref:Uncharacterized protein n=1 Tax=Caerostris darwini TaxID=1538125 RepID=A0AAV4VIZ5_9ARAC|nr:hypothetical protein CDAR_586941 [Caerostris darwini]
MINLHRNIYKYFLFIRPVPSITNTQYSNKLFHPVAVHMSKVLHRVTITMTNDEPFFRQGAELHPRSGVRKTHQLRVPTQRSGIHLRGMLTVLRSTGEVESAC